MEIKIICLLFTAYVNVLVCAENYPLREGFRISIENFEPESSDTESHKRYGRVIKVERDNDESREAENLLDATELMEESHRKILAFGKRVFESVKEHEILKDKASLIESGEYRIDWWKNDRRLAKIRKRLYKELARMPDLNDHLHRLGWRNTSKDFIPKKKNQLPIMEIQRSLVQTRNTFVNKIMKLSFKEFVDIDAPELDEETMDDVPIMFVYMKFLRSRPKKINRVDPTANVPKSPTKFSLDATEPQDFDTSDVGVLDIESHSLPISNPIDGSLSAMNSGGDSIDTDRLLQLIPLVVDELRNDRFTDEERRSLGWIFGKRLWQLLERDACKNADEMMDKELASFLVKGELPERDSERPKRRLGKQSGISQWDHLSERKTHEPVTKSDDDRKSDVSRSLNESHDMQKPKNMPFFYFYRNNNQEHSENLLNLQFTNLARFFGPKKNRHENPEEGARYEIEENLLDPMDEYEDYFSEYFQL